jgi:GTP 3',8-cyclase
MVLLDSHNRKIDYLRLSVTENCNLRCSYCMPLEARRPTSKAKPLVYSEIVFLVNILAGLGIKKIRLTGGEPLLFPQLLRLIKDIRKIKEIKNISLTTNGVLLDKYLDGLRALDIDSINISLDCLSFEKYKMITGHDYSARVYKNILKALDMGFRMIKVNSVISPYLDKDDITGLIERLKDLPLVLRFIDMMPTNAVKNVECRVSSNNGACSIKETANTTAEIIGSLEGYAPTKRSYGFGPARYYSSKKNPLVVGVINNDDESCFFCNRLRLTSEGRLILCIFSGKSLELKKEIAKDPDKARISGLIKDFVKEKPKNRTYASVDSFENCLNECMYKIGG